MAYQMDSTYPMEANVQHEAQETQNTPGFYNRVHVQVIKGHSRSFQVNWIPNNKQKEEKEKKENAQYKFSYAPIILNQKSKIKT